MEENKRLDIEFKTTVIRFFKTFMEKADKFNETLEDMKKDQLEIKHTLTEIKNIIQRPNSRLEDRKNQLKDLEYKEAKDTPPEKQEEKRIQKVEDSFHHVQNRARFFVQDARTALAMKDVSYKICDEENRKNKLELEEMEQLTTPHNLLISNSWLPEDLVHHDIDIILNRRNCMAATLQIIEENFPEVGH
ncbi:hypothetical protein QTO34_000507 [Cnephaeus nilssonii]|uniref:Uncharacterized protein n=1 Tax=Cnephaeus nilssonii TaxID=3371016 RepID=A0AA40ICL1_CNENI|nr:hypothetical protein QTO34_000507 [Eptesicus nilssonii]